MFRCDLIKGVAKRTYTYTDFDIINSVPVSPSVIDPLCVDFVRDSDGKVLSYALTSDIGLLFNQKRLEDTLGRDGMKKFFDDMAARSSALSELRSKISDDDLAALCKSRYLQSASEILAWSNYLNENYETLMSSVKSRVAAAAAASSAASAAADGDGSASAAGDGSVSAE